MVGYCWTRLHGPFDLALSDSMRLGLAGILWSLAASQASSWATRQARAPVQSGLWGFFLRVSVRYVVMRRAEGTASRPGPSKLRKDGEAMTTERLRGDHLELVNQAREHAEGRELLKGDLLVPLLVLMRRRVAYKGDAGQAELQRPPLTALDGFA